MVLNPPSFIHAITSEPFSITLYFVYHRSSSLFFKLFPSPPPYESASCSTSIAVGPYNRVRGESATFFSSSLWDLNDRTRSFPNDHVPECQSTVPDHVTLTTHTEPSFAVVFYLFGGWVFFHSPPPTDIPAILPLHQPRPILLLFPPPLFFDVLPVMQAVVTLPPYPLSPYSLTIILAKTKAYVLALLSHFHLAIAFDVSSDSSTFRIVTCFSCLPLQ